MSADFGDISDGELLSGMQLIEQFEASDVSDMESGAMSNNSAGCSSTCAVSSRPLMHLSLTGNWLI